MAEEGVPPSVAAEAEAEAEGDAAPASGAGDGGAPAPPPAAGEGAGGAAAAPRVADADTVAWIRGLVQQVVAYGTGGERPPPVIRRWMRSGPDGAASVAHLRVLRQRGNGRCGFHALYNASVLHAAAGRAGDAARGEPDALLDATARRELHDPMAVYSFITFVERALGREALLHKTAGDYFWNFAMLADDVIERAHMAFVLNASALPPTLVAEAQGGATPVAPSPGAPAALVTPLSPADEGHWARIAGLGDYTTLLNEFGPSSLRMNSDVKRTVAQLAPPVARLQSAATAAAAAANAWEAGGRAGVPPQRPPGSHHCFLLGTGVHWLTVFAEAHAVPAPAVDGVPGIVDRRAVPTPPEEGQPDPPGTLGGLRLVATVRLDDTSAGLGDEAGEPGAPTPSGHVVAAPPDSGGWLPAFSLYVADSLNADYYLADAGIRRGVVDTFSHEVDARLPPRFVRAGCEEYMTATDVLLGTLCGALTGALALPSALAHAHVRNLLGTVPPAVTRWTPLAAPDYMRAPVEVLRRGLVQAEPFLREQRWRTRRKGGRIFAELEAEAAGTTRMPCAGEAGEPTGDLAADIRTALGRLLWFFDVHLPPAVFRRGVTRNTARILGALHPGVAGGAADGAVDALVEACASPLTAPVPRAAPPDTDGEGETWAALCANAPAVPRGEGVSSAFLEPPLVTAYSAFVASALALLAAVPGEEGEEEAAPAAAVGAAAAAAWGELSDTERARGVAAAGVLRQLRRLLAAFGYWAPPPSVWA